MNDDLPEEYDLIVVGTGFTESCIAAAASRIGKTVLHIDQNDFYGGAWASFSLDNLNSFFDNNTNPEVINCSYQWHIKDDIADDSQKICIESLLDQSRRFSIDLCPKIIFSAGTLVQLLITSNICRYAEFRAVDRVCTIYNDEILSVPCSRSDVFNTKDLGVLEKRMLMKFLNSCITFSEDKYQTDFLEYKDKSFIEYLQSQRLTEKIQKCIIQAIAMCKDDTSFEVGIEQTLKFLKSIGRYGNTPFLFPMYGCGEIPQCFCRLCAVYGGIYCLKKKIDSIQVKENVDEVHVMTDNQVLRSKHLVTSFGIIKTLEDKSLAVGSITNRISRGIFLSTKPLGNEELNSGCGGINILRLLNNNREAILIQLSHYSGTCPKDIYLFHIITPAVSADPKEDLQPFLEKAFDRNGITQSLVYTAFFTLTGCTIDWTTILNNSKPLINITEPVFYELDYDCSIDNARKIFSNMYPDQEFLPRAPDPEEIVVDGEDPVALTEGSLPEDLREHFRQLEMEKSSNIIEDVQPMEE